MQFLVVCFRLINRLIARSLALKAVDIPSKVSTLSSRVIVILGVDN